METTIKMETTSHLAPLSRTVGLHLGNGSSPCATSGGKRAKSTMGFSGMEGLPMGTRCG